MLTYFSFNFRKQMISVNLLLTRMSCKQKDLEFFKGNFNLPHRIQLHNVCLGYKGWELHVFVQVIQLQAFLKNKLLKETPIKKQVNRNNSHSKWINL